MTEHTTTVKKATQPPGAKVAGRVFSISMNNIPRVTAQTKARMQAAARNPAVKRRDYPRLVTE